MRHATPERTSGLRAPGPGRGAPVQPRRLGAGARPHRSPGDPRPAGHHPAPRPGAHPLRTDGRLGLRLLPGGGRGDGRRPGHADQTGLEVQLCGDAHLSNFGGFASPERDMIFDVNDFDETIPGPFEWDLKRLAASLEIAGRGRELRRGAPGARSWPGHPLLPDGHAGVRRHAGPGHLVLAARRRRHRRPRWGEAGQPADREPASDAVAKARVQGPPGRPGQADHRGRRPADAS